MHQFQTKLLIQCINLQSSEARRVRMSDMAAANDIEFEFVEGVAATDVEKHSGAPYYNTDRRRLSFANELTRGERACVLSHHKALNRFLESTAPFTLILEDNANVLADFSAIFSQIDWHCADFDMIRLETRRCSVLNMPVYRQKQFRLNICPRVSLGTTAIVYSRAGAKKVIDSLGDYYQPYDTHLGRFWRHGFKVLTLDPPIFERASVRDVPSVIAQSAGLQGASAVGHQRYFTGRDLLVCLRNRRDVWLHEVAKFVVALAQFADFKRRQRWSSVGASKLTPSQTPEAAGPPMAQRSSGTI